MPILAPEIQRAMRAAGLVRDSSASAKDTPLVERLEATSGLALDTILEKLGELVHSGNESLQKSAIETALKLHGVLKEQAAPMPSVTIVIRDSFSSSSSDSAGSRSERSQINPILIPRKTCLAEVISISSGSGSGTSNELTEQ